MRTLAPIGSLAAVGLLAACTSGQSAQPPSMNVSTIASDKAALAVGIATFTDGSKGLNTVATFRMPSGASATLVNTPTLTGPAGFVVPAVAAAGTDGGTNHISASPQVTSGTPTDTTFSTTGGVFSYGFAPANSDTSGSANSALYPQPFYGASALAGGFADANAAPVPFEGGPPSYPNVRTGTFPSGFDGYTQGFNAFAAAPVAGAYALSIVVASSNAGTQTFAAPPATLANVAGLAAVATPTFVEDGAGGGTASFVAPPGTTESLVDFYDTSAVSFYSVLVPGTGALTAKLPDAVGIFASGAAGATLATGDTYEMTVICADYPLFENGPPQSIAQVPTLVGAAGQADIAFSPSLTGTYGMGAAPAARARRVVRKR